MRFDGRISVCNEAIVVLTNDRVCELKCCADFEASDSIVQGSNSKKISTLPAVSLEPCIGGYASFPIFCNMTTVCCSRGKCLKRKSLQRFQTELPMLRRVVWQWMYTKAETAIERSKIAVLLNVRARYFHKASRSCRHTKVELKRRIEECCRTPINDTASCTRIELLTV